ncbi:MAG: hypothetical protein FD121_1323 [Gallionellaceae bacterium]|nr:MAG: hypothetical protein FD121_1323 [Gallionellaceae bacterium]
MAYFIYRIKAQPIKLLEKLEQHETYRAASERVKLLREAEVAAGSKALVKMIHADNELHAEDLLNQVREPAPELGDD